MYKIGDKIKIGSLIGEVAEVYCKTKIGFVSRSEVSYDIVLRGVPEETIKPKDDGTD